MQGILSLDDHILFYSTRAQQTEQILRWSELWNVPVVLNRYGSVQKRGIYRMAILREIEKLTTEIRGTPCLSQTLRLLRRENDPDHLVIRRQKMDVSLATCAVLFFPTNQDAASRTMTSIEYGARSGSELLGGSSHLVVGE